MIIATGFLGMKARFNAEIILLSPIVSGDLLFSIDAGYDKLNNCTLVNVELTNEDALLRAVSKLSTTMQMTEFTNAVRHRDRGCVVTKEAQGELLIKAGLWSGFEAAHVFPLAYSALWADQGFNAAITTPGPNGDNINSVQNGILRADLHQLFDTYHFSISTKVCLQYIALPCHLFSI